MTITDQRTATSIDKKLGQRVRTRRLEIGMSQEKLAELLGVTFQQVQKYEKGVNRIAASRMVDIGGALNLPVAKFFEGLGGRDDDGGSAIDEALATPEGAQLMAIFARIKRPKVRRQIVELAKSVSEDAK